MKITTRFILTVTIAIAVTVLATGLASSFLLQKSFSTAEERELKAYFSQFQSSVENWLENAAARSALVAGIPAVQKAYKTQDRQTLADMFLPGFKMQKEQYGVRQFQFHLIPATSFLRVHKAEKHGDDLSGFRKTIVETNATKEPVTGLERGRAGIGARGIHPVFDGGTHVGSVEFGLSFDQSFFDDFKRRTGADIAFFIKPVTNLEAGAEKNTAPKQIASTYNAETSFSAEDISLGFEAEHFLGGQTLGDVNVSSLVAPVKDFSGNTIGTVYFSIETAEYQALLLNSLLILGVVAIVCLLVGGGVAVINGRLFTAPILSLSNAMDSLAAGDLNTVISGTDRKDEIAQMAQSVGVFQKNAIEKQRLEQEQEVARLQVAQEQQEREKLEQQQVQEKAEAERQAEEDKKQALSDMVGQFESSVGNIVEGVASAATELQSTAQSMSDLSRDTNEQAKTVAISCETATSNVQSVASAAEELSSSISEISRQVSQSSSITNQAVGEAEKANELIKGLEAGANSIGEVVSLINDIAEQTNLLALNATIEAARAGEAGKGFTVVASEVKNLASQTGRATEQISAQINEVQASTVAAVKAIQEISTTIGKVNEIATVIASAVEEQGAATQEISQNVQSAASGTSEVSGSIARVTESASQSGIAAQDVLTAAADLSKQSENLSLQVSNFVESVRDR